MSTQPHFDDRALHRFYGSHQHYTVLMLLGFLLLCLSAALFREIYSVVNSHQTNAQVQYGMKYSAYLGETSDAPILVFHDPEQGEIRYRVVEEPLKSKIQQISSYWESVPIRYEIDITGDVYALELYTLMGTVSWTLIYCFLLCLVALAMYRLSPRPFWYWHRAEKHFQYLAEHYICLEVRVKQLHELTLKHHGADRMCTLSGTVYLYQQNQLLNVHSPRFLVEAQFRMSYPVMKVYFNPKNLDDYEVDLLDFLKKNHSSLHGFAAASYYTPSSNQHIAS